MARLSSRQKGCLIMLDNKFFRIAISIILILLILFLFKQVDYIFMPLVNVLTFLLYPLLLSVFFYYLLRPAVRFLTAKIRRQGLAIFLTFLVVIMIIVSISIFGGNIIQKQIKDLTHNLTNYYTFFRRTIDSGVENEFLQSLLDRYDIEEKLASFVETILNSVQQNLFGFFSTVTNIGTIVILIPFIIYYFLKDENKIYEGLIAILPEKFKDPVVAILNTTDQTLSKYITGQLIVAVVLGVLTFIGYKIIGLPNALILSLIVVITSFIPFIGAVLGALPAILIASTTNLLLIIKVIIVLVVVQQLEGNLISPRLHGSRLQIHPLIVILIVMASFILFGVLGALFAVPSYSVIRIAVKEAHKYRILTQQGGLFHEEKR